MVLYLCFRFFIFDKLILKEYVFQVEGRPHLFQSCLHVTWNDLLFVVRGMHLSFDNLTIIGAPSLHVSLMDIHHNSSFQSILEDDSISSTSKVHICFLSNKRIRLWLINRPSIRLFRIAHSTFASTLHYYFNLI
jgi:hypothetical protein